jgi:hypothetical protein
MTEHKTDAILCAIEYAPQAAADNAENELAALLAENARLEAALAEARKDNEALRFFAGLAIKAVRGQNVGNDWDGGSIQDAMVAAGILCPWEMAAPCGDGCVCGDVGDFPLACYRLTDLGLACATAADDAARHADGKEGGADAR